MKPLLGHFKFLLPILFGIVSFFVVVGPLPLDPSNIGWLNGLDPSTNYLGWVFFRNTPWTFPLGLNPAYGLDISSSIVYSDSIPLLAIFFKIFSPYLSEPFQYIGIWILSCFILQAWFSWQLSKLISDHLLIRLLICGLLGIFAPPMLKRLGLHAALMGQFLVLAGLYLNLRPQNHYRLLYWLILLASSSLVNFYLLVMVITLWVANISDQWLTQNKITATSVAKELFACIFSTIFLMWQAGYFLGIDNPIRAEGFGSYKLNLLSLFDANHWSYILPNIETPEDLGEGFNFLGLGLLYLIAPFLFVLFSRHISFYLYVKRFPFLFIGLIGLTFFALSNQVSFGMSTMELPWPKTLIEWSGILRSSGRLFWPTYYCLVLVMLAVISSRLSNKILIILFSSALILQIIDTSAGWWPLHRTFNELSKKPFPNPLNNPFWMAAAKHYRNIVIYPSINNQAQLNWQAIAYFAATNELATNAVYLGRKPNIASIDQFNTKIKLQILSASYDPDTLYIFSSPFEIKNEGKFYYHPQKDFFGVVNGFTVLAPNWQEVLNHSTSKKLY